MKGLQPHPHQITVFFLQKFSWPLYSEIWDVGLSLSNVIHAPPCLFSQTAQWRIITIPIVATVAQLSGRCVCHHGNWPYQRTPLNAFVICQLTPILLKDLTHAPIVISSIKAPNQNKEPRLNMAACNLPNKDTFPFQIIQCWWKMICSLTRVLYLALAHPIYRILSTSQWLMEQNGLLPSWVLWLTWQPGQLVIFWSFSFFWHIDDLWLTTKTLKLIWLIGATRRKREKRPLSILHKPQLWCALKKNLPEGYFSENMN